MNEEKTKKSPTPALENKKSSAQHETMKTKAKTAAVLLLIIIIIWAIIAFALPHNEAGLTSSGNDTIHSKPLAEESSYDDEADAIIPEETAPAALEQNTPPREDTLMDVMIDALDEPDAAPPAPDQSDDPLEMDAMSGDVQPQADGSDNPISPPLPMPPAPPPPLAGDAPPVDFAPPPPPPLPPTQPPEASAAQWHLVPVLKCQVKLHNSQHNTIALKDALSGCYAVLRNIGVSLADQKILNDIQTQDGVPSKTAMKSLFNDAALQALRAGKKSDSLDKTWLDKSIEYMDSIITVRRKGWQEGDSMEAVIGRAEHYLQQEKYLEAKQQLEALPDYAEKAFVPFNQAVLQHAAYKNINQALSQAATRMEGENAL